MEGGMNKFLLSIAAVFCMTCSCFAVEIVKDGKATAEIVIPKDARNVENAEAFMNFILRPDVSRMISDAFPYLNPNLAARALLTPAQRANPASFPSDEDLKKLQSFEDIGLQARKIDEMVTALKGQ